MSKIKCEVRTNQEFKVTCLINVSNNGNEIQVHKAHDKMSMDEYLQIVCSRKSTYNVSFTIDGQDGTQICLNVHDAPVINEFGEKGFIWLGNLSVTKGVYSRSVGVCPEEEQSIKVLQNIRKIADSMRILGDSILRDLMLNSDALGELKKSLVDFASEGLRFDFVAGKIMTSTIEDYISDVEKFSIKSIYQWAAEDNSLADEVEEVKENFAEEVKLENVDVEIAGNTIGSY